MTRISDLATHRAWLLTRLSCASIIADPTETTDLAAKLPDVLERLKQRHTELMETALPQAHIVYWNAHVWSWVQAPPEYIAALRRNRGFVGPWLNEG